MKAQGYQTSKTTLNRKQKAGGSTHQTARCNEATATGQTRRLRGQRFRTYTSAANQFLHSH